MAKGKYQGITVDIAFRGEPSKFNEAVTQVEKGLKSIDTELGRVNRDLKLDPTNTTLVGQRFELLGEKIKSAQEKLKMLKDAQSQIEQAYSRGEIDKGAYRDFQREIARTESQLKNLNTEIQNTVQAVTSDLKKAVADLKTEFEGAASVIKKAELALVAFSAASAKTGADFESAMSQVAATMGIDQLSAEYEKLSAAAKEMGKTTSFTAGDAAFALNALGQAGYTADEAIERLPKTLALAKAGGLDLASAAKIVTNSMAALNLSEKELDVLLDEMARTAQKSNTNIRELGESIKTVGGTMDMAGQSMETMFTELGMLANAGITASEAGTHLRNIMLSLAKTDVRGALHEMGVETVDASGKIRDLCDIMVDLREVTKNMQSGELIETFGKLFNVRDLASINALLSGTTGSMQALRTEIENSQGAAMQMADTMSDNLASDVTILKSALEGLQIAVSEKLNPSLRSAAQHVTRLMGELTGSAKTGALADDFERFGESLSKLITNGATLASDVLPTVISMLTFVAEHADLILATYVGIKAEAKAKFLLTSVKNLTEGVITLRTAVQGAAVAQEGLNAAAAANPMNAIITAGAVLIGSLSGLLTKLALDVDVTNEKFREMSEEVKQITEAANTEIDAANELLAANKELADSLEKQERDYHGLAVSLYSLADAEELSAGEKQKMLAYVDELNSAIPGLNLSIDSTTGALSKESSEVEKLISSYLKMEKLKAHISNVSALELEQERLQAQYAEMKQKRLEAIEKRNRAYNSLSISERKKDDLANPRVAQLHQADDELAAINAKFASLGNEIREVNAQLEKENRLIEELSADPLVNVSQAAQGIAKSMTGAADASNKDTSATEKNAKATADLTSKTSDCRSELTSLLGVLDKVNSGTAYSTSQILDLIAKYPELAGAIHTTADGYRIEAEAVENLTRVKAQELLVSMKAQIAEAKAQARVKEAIARIGAGITGDTSTLSRIQAEIRGLDDTLAGYERLVNDISSGRIYKGSSPSASSYSGSSSSSSSYEDKTDRYKQQAEAEISALEHEYKMGRMTAEEYYNALDELNKKFYQNKSEYLDDYRKYEEKVYAGLQKIQEERINAAKTLEDRLIAAKKAQDDLTNAQNQQVNVYGGAAGWHAETNSAAVGKAQQALFEKQQSLSEILAKTVTLGGLNTAAITDNVLPNLRALLPDLSGLRLPGTQASGGTVTNNAEKNVNITYSPDITIQGSATPENIKQLKDTLEQQFNKLINDYINNEYNKGVIT